MKKAWHNFQRYYFSFNRSDRNSITVLSVFIFLLLLLYSFLPYFFPRTNEDLSEIKAAFDAWENQVNSAGPELEQSLFIFDPNAIDSAALDSLELPAFVKQNLIRYRNAGGKFKSEADFRKIYGMNDSIFAVIQPHLNISETKRDNSGREKEFVFVKRNEAKQVLSDPDNGPISNLNQERFIIEINTADSAKLLSLPGIGPVFARRIISYRNLLGGFYQKEQLKEVYNLPPETFQRISSMIEADSLLVKKLRINFQDFSGLLRHPYLNKEQVKAILERRENQGAYKNLSEVALLQAFDSESFARVRPYLTCD